MIESSEYGKALYSLAQDQKNEDALLYQMSQISIALSENTDFINLLDTPAIKVSERLEIVDRVFSHVNLILLNFIKILTENRSVRCFEKCYEVFSSEYDRFHNIERVTAITAVQMNGHLIDELQKKLSEITKRSVFVTNKVEPDIIGGITLRFADRQIDNSISTRLKEFEKHIYSVTL